MSYLETVEKVSMDAGYEFSNDEIDETVRYVNRKLEIIGKDESYFDLLFEEELKHYLIARQMYELVCAQNTKMEG